jgi:hypothetical protein
VVAPGDRTIEDSGIAMHRDRALCREHTLPVSPRSTDIVHTASDRAHSNVVRKTTAEPDMPE